MFFLRLLKNKDLSQNLHDIKDIMALNICKEKTDLLLTVVAFAKRKKRLKKTNKKKKDSDYLVIFLICHFVIDVSKCLLSCL